MPEIQSVRRVRQSSKHDRTGCITCRKRHKKCVPNTFPTCGNCERLNLECVRQPRRNVVDVEKHHPYPYGQRIRDVEPSNGITTRPQAVLPQPNLGPIDRDRAAIHYFITVLARHLTVSDEHNSFLSVYIPLAIESPALCDSIRAWSWSHLSISDSSYNLLAAEARLKAIRAVSAALLEPRTHLSGSEANTAACLVLLSADIGHGDFESWYNHLTGARDIMLSARGTCAIGIEAFKKTPEGQWLLRNFAYHDIIGSVTRGKPPLLEGYYLKGITDVVDSYLGVASEVLIHISDISQTIEKLSASSSPSECTNAKFSFMKLESELLEWRYHADTPPDLANMADAYRGSALILLYTAWLKIPTSDILADNKEVVHEKISREVAAVLTAIERIPIGASAETSLLFPLFIAGRESRISRDINLIRARLLATLEKRRFRNISRALDILERTWRRGCSDGDSNGNDSNVWGNVPGSMNMDLLLT